MIDYQRIERLCHETFVREALRSIPEKGDGSVCLYLECRTSAIRDLSGAIRRGFPDTITILLNNGYNSLSVHEKHIQVRVSFDGVWQTIWIPFWGILKFTDSYEGKALVLAPVLPRAEKRSSPLPPTMTQRAPSSVSINFGGSNDYPRTSFSAALQGRHASEYAA